MCNDVRILFGDIYADEPGMGSFVVRKGSKLVSPFEYAYFWRLTPKSCALQRGGSQRVDILFENGRWFFGAFYAHDLAKMEQDKDKHLIAALVQHGTHVLNEEGDYLAFISGYPRITLIYDSFLVAFQEEGPTPRVRVYDLHGCFLSEGELWDALTKAMERS
jgi:hypothetical protein